MQKLLRQMKKNGSASRVDLALGAMVLLSGLALLFVLILFPIDGVSGGGLPRFLGRFHPLILHFPIVLLPLALGAELFRFSSSPWRKWAAAGLPLLFLAAVMANLTACLGILLAANEGHAGELIRRHRLLGVGVAVFANVALGLRMAAQVRPSHKVMAPALLTTLFAGCALMMFAAHDGGSMVHGQSYLSQYAPGPLKKIFASSRTKGTIKSADSKKFTASGFRQNEVLLTAFSSDVAPTIERYCSSCHGPSKQKGGIRFDELSAAMESDLDVDVWSSVRDALNAHQMPPPKEARQPSPQDRQRIVSWIDQSFEHVASQRLANRRSPMRRLTVDEYVTTLQDLFGTSFKFGEALPSAPKSDHGYSRDASLLRVSALEMEYFLSIARDAVDTYVLFEEPIPESEHFIIEFENTLYRPGVDGGYSVEEPLSNAELTSKLKDKDAKPAVYADRTLFPLPDGPTVAGSGLQRAVIQKFNGKYARFQSRQPHKGGELIAKVRAAAKLGKDGTAPQLRLRVGVSAGSDFAAATLGECDVTAPISDPQTCTFRVPLRDIPVEFDGDPKTLTALVFNTARVPGAVYGIDPDGLNRSPNRPRLLARLRKATMEAIESKGAMRKAEMNELYLDSLEIDIVPFGVDQSKPLWRVDAVRAAQNSGAEARAVAEDTLFEFMRRAYRRPVSNAEVSEMLALYDQFVLDGDNFQRALSETMSSVLISDQFLYIAAPVPSNPDLALSGDERTQLAARLSYFLWNSLPDDRLMDLASEDRLTDPAVLASEISRMLDDNRARRFTEKFAKEWLRLDKFELVAVNPEFYPFYDDDLGADMVAETITTFQEIFHGHKDARELIASDTVYVNQRLARHYGLPPVTGGDFQAVKVPDYRSRGGLLQQGAVLTMTADGQESNPIYRGVWILERILNDPPPPPPPSVPPLEEASEDLGPLTLKQKIERHRSQSACSACHAKIDPWGLALENFDAIGASRKEALVINASSGIRSYLAIDVSTVVDTGEEINGSDELSEFIYSAREEEFTRSLTWHMTAYALGRVPNIGDEAEIDQIYAYFRASGYKIPALVLAITQSDVFQAAPVTVVASYAGSTQPVTVSGSQDE
ncbi:MAG: DUF1592 domain-containing protein [Litorimonas sp.]